jgi:hemoglobin
MNPSLYERIGKKEMVEKASHYLYVNILRDERLSPFFKDVDIEKQQRKMSAFLTYIFGGNSLYTGRSLRLAHENVVKAGLNDTHVNAMINCVRKTLQELKLDDELIDEAVQAIEKHRDDVLLR